MPITLTTPIDTGDLDPNGPYTQVKIIGFGLDIVGKRIDLVCQYGNTIESEWIHCLELLQNVSVAIKDEGEATDYTTLISSESEAAEEVYYDMISGLLYQYLIDKGIFIGTIT